MWVNLVLSSPTLHLNKKLRVKSPCLWMEALSLKGAWRSGVEPGARCGVACLHIEPAAGPAAPAQCLGAVETSVTTACQTRRYSC